MNFEQITLEQEEVAKAKFLEHGKGVLMNNLMAYTEADEASAKWHELIKPAMHSEQNVINRMRGLAVSIKQSCNDPMLGDLNIAFIHTTELDESIPFTYEDCYLFLRAVLRHRRNTADYKTKKARIVMLQDTIERSKTPREKRKDAKAELKTLQESL